MASQLHDVEIDWGWPRLSEHERAIVRRHDAVLASDRKAHTVETAEAALRSAAAELPGRSIRARAVDDERTHGWQVVYPEGRSESGPLHSGADVYPCDEFDEAGMFPGELTAADFRAAGVSIVLTPIVFPDSMLRSIEERGWHTDGALSTLVQGAWQLAADLLPAGFRTPNGPRRVQPIYLPVDVWASLQDRAKAEERSVSYLVQRAVTAAYELPVE
jgi:hypothetical protein